MTEILIPIALLASVLLIVSLAEIYTARDCSTVAGWQLSAQGCILVLTVAVFWMVVAG